MKAAHYARLKSLFIEACERDPAERDAFLAEACGGDDELRDAVLRLLAADDDDDGQAVNGDIPVPRRIGPYEVRGILGTGGMGIVYRAAQDAPRREVAIKVLRQGLLAPRMARRFAREAEVLGRLQHPGIAQVFEAGTWEGRPYFAMELIDGVPLTEYADRGGLDARGRLRLLVAVCRAVHHAHETGVVHRDLKPGNILVTRGGQPKILDFGIARATNADLQVTTVRTDAGQLVGTLPYMAPEQVEGDPSRIDARCDVYALGVLMYELLAGRLPLDLSNRSVPDAARVIRDEDPPTLRTINRSYRGDLDTIAATALEKDRDRRYPSAEALAAEIERYLNNEPLVARPPSALYQAGKFARRHKGLTAGLAASVALLVAGTAVSLVFAMRATERSRQLQVEADKLGALNTFFESMLTAADPQVNRLGLRIARDVKVTDVLDWAADHLATAYPDQPEVEATLRMTLGSAYWSLELRDEAAEQFETAVTLRSASLGPEHPQTLRAELQAIQGMSAAGRHADAEARARRLLPICERVFGRDHVCTITCLGRLYGQLYYQQKWDEARAVGEDYLARATAALPPDHEERRGAVIDLGYLYIKLGEPRRALAMFRETTDLAVRLYGDLDPRTILSKHNIVLALRALKRYDEAIALQREVEAAQATVLGPDHPVLATEMNLLADLLRERGADGEAESLRTPPADK